MPSKPKNNNNAASRAMPYDAAYRDALENLTAQRVTFIDELHRQQQLLRRQFNEQSGDYRRQEKYGFQNVLNNYAGRGMLDSTGAHQSYGLLNQQYARDEARMQNDYNLQRGQLGYWVQNPRNNGPNVVPFAGSQLADYVHNYNTQLDLLRRAATRRLAAKAGQ